MKQIYSQYEPDWKVSDPVENIQFLAQAYPSFERKAPQAIHDLRGDLFQFGTTLDRFGLDVSDLEKKGSFGRLISFMIQQIGAFLIGLPFALLGFILFLIPYQAVRFLAYLKSFDLDIVATVKLMSGFIFYGVWWILLTGYLGMHYGGKGILGALFLYPLVGIHTLLFIENRSRAWTSFMLMMRIMTLRSPKILLVKDNAIIRLN